MTSIFQASQEKAEKVALAQTFGPTMGNQLSKVSSPTTTMAFYRYFQTSGTKIKKFFTHDIPSIFQKPRTPMKMIIMSVIFICVMLLSVMTYNYINSYEGFTVNTSDRNYDIQNIVNQLSVTTAATNTETNQIKSSGTDTLLNIQPLTFKQAAYLGPTTNGLFDANNGILNQLKVGARTFFLQIDYIESPNMNSENFCKQFDPCLLYKNTSGALVSLNSASIADVCKAIGQYAFNDVIPNPANPIIIILHFVRLPYAPTDDNYIKYLSKVSTALEVIKPLLITGGYYRSAKESAIFTTDYTTFKNTIIIGTNINTKIFTKVTVDQAKDLDYKINFNYYQMSTENVDATVVAPVNMVNVNALIFNAATILAMSSQQWAIYKNYFIIVKTSNDLNLSLEHMNKLISVYGVNVITYDYFSGNISAAKSVKQLYGSKYAVKPLVLQA